MCGQCHRQELARFKTGRHISDSGTPRIDCVGCHGAHSIGPLTRSFVSTCAGCHGLEYLPELPRPLADALELSDDVRRSIAGIYESGGLPSEEVLSQRRVIRKLTAEIVHPTDLHGGADKVPEILKLGAELRGKLKKN